MGTNEARDHEDGGTITVDRAEIARALAKRKPSLGELAALGAELALGPVQLAALLGGCADLRLTPTQLANLKASAAAALAGTKEAESEDGTSSASLCGSTGTPSGASPAPTTAPTVPSVTASHTGFTETAAGTTLQTDTVGAGAVTIRRDVEGTVGTRTIVNAFALSYKGADSADAHWLQFIHREIIGIDSAGTATPLTDAITTSGTRGGSYALTPGGTATTFGTPGAANYNTDSASATDPFYEAGFAANRAAGETSMFDKPAAHGKVNAAFANGAARVISRAHFDTFLVQTDKVTYHSSLTVAYDFASATATPAPTTTLHAAGAASALPSTIQQRFHAQYPAFTFIK